MAIQLITAILDVYNDARVGARQSTSILDALLDVLTYAYIRVLKGEKDRCYIDGLVRVPNPTLLCYLTRL